MSLIKKAFTALYPEKEFNYISKIKYSGKFSDFNANIRRQGNFIEIGLSKKWKDIGEEIKIGLIQHLLMRMFKQKKSTLYTELYESFVRNLSKYTPITKTDPMLKESFDRVNIKYFNELMDLPNLRFGQASIRQLGAYNYHNDTITISTILKDDLNILDYVMYHELLHKKESFQSKNGQLRYHTTQFKALEKQFENWQEIEAKIKQLVRKKKVKKNFIKNFFPL
ncbi:M48 family metallopeptidase [Candidatus Woesearchaeota archaeon]|jgi:predicted metal-dependent hydrolase|nr:M48 family metallopeptidase [Candidatus Woesearchaeota archaeon]MBT4368902.1 M48 family metallopeptidase [Candidatus Woesearchaeota archaeon]MBT4712191.1 M48 family metallopeptidase [Candidatus Woesearchaeota archaeon]MBT6639061.1 M48 family metallopeptidase [Candidatus Woesearchaeota archaeon]MBT7134261.1 M48 family metallopeptidase [Candidatus Woesearchaeota archaeon]